MEKTITQNLDRKLYIGGSDAAAILGVSPWHTAVDVYLQKQGEEAHHSEATLRRFARGKLREPVRMDHRIKINHSR